MDVYFDELNWLAGFFDGEGCISITTDTKNRKHPCHKLTAVLHTNSKDIEVFLKDKFGGNCSIRKGQGNHQDTYRWQVYGDKAVAFIKVIMPYLRLKNRQAEIAIEFQETIGKRGGKIERGVYELRQRLRDEIRMLNGNQKPYPRQM